MGIAMALMATTVRVGVIIMLTTVMSCDAKIIRPQALNHNITQTYFHWALILEGEWMKISGYFHAVSTYLLMEGKPMILSVATM
jgi:hypothetical protein